MSFCPPRGVFLDTKLSARAKDIPIRKTHATSLKINVAIDGGSVDAAPREVARQRSRPAQVSRRVAHARGTGRRMELAGPRRMARPGAGELRDHPVRGRSVTGSAGGRSNLWLWSGG